MIENRELQELTADECWALLGRGSVGRLAVAIQNQPDLFPVNYRVDDDTIVIRTAAGLKLAAAVLGRSVAFEADELDEMRHCGASVVVKGKAVEIERVDEVMEAQALNVEPWAAGPRQRYVRIVPDSITGRRIPWTR